MLGRAISIWGFSGASRVCGSLACLTQHSKVDQSQPIGVEIWWVVNMAEVGSSIQEVNITQFQGGYSSCGRVLKKAGSLCLRTSWIQMSIGKVQDQSCRPSPAVPGTATAPAAGPCLLPAVCLWSCVPVEERKVVPTGQPPRAGQGRDWLSQSKQGERRVPLGKETPLPPPGPVLEPFWPYSLLPPSSPQFLKLSGPG